MTKISFISLILLTLIACGRNKRVLEKEQAVLQKQHKDNSISELTDKYAIKYKLDTIDFSYSVQYDKIIESGYQLIDDIDINDIYRKDGIPYVSLIIWSWPTFFCDLTVSDEIMNRIIDNQSIDHPIKGDNAVLVVKLYEIKKIKLKIDSYPGDEGYWNIEFVDSDDFIAKGEIVDLIIIK